MTAGSVEANKATVEAYHLRLWRDGDASAIDDFWSSDAVVHIAGFDQSALSAVKEDYERYRRAFTDIETSILDLLGEDDRVVLHWRTSGTHVGTYGVVSATGKRITMSGVDILTLENGKVVAGDSVWDGLDVFDQLGVLPPLY